MGSSFAALQQMGMLDGSQREGFFTGQTFISYFQVESMLWEYPKVLEAGVIVLSDSTQKQTLHIYLALEENSMNEREINAFCSEVANFVRNQFVIGCSLRVQVREKLPMTRSGKILRTVLKDWNTSSPILKSID
ncbi:AMP-binding enzyme [Desulfitobacterium sp.]|uniref:AMP-binding enzyme n=1 Tax=Desulfitobacterium sp. TaxID=49981 RepID=UPI002C210503|nr:acyl-CoA synthetase [Desulfitobacterium sp.]HVJ50687.1 acyl-CoA synthetase [Desulfitobacterium sp.]